MQRRPVPQMGALVVFVGFVGPHVEAQLDDNAEYGEPCWEGKEEEYG